MALACKQAKNVTVSADSASVAVVHDAHSLARPDSVAVTHLFLDIAVDFNRQVISGVANWDIENKTGAKQIVFDSDGLGIGKVLLDDSTATTFSFDSPKPFIGEALRIAILPGTKKVSIYYVTGKNATALQWLAASQTTGKKSPFLFTQSEPTLARTWVPCQDGPATRFTYEAKVQVPKGLVALMSAQNPQQASASGIYTFKQTHSIPSYLLALAAGDIAFKAIDAHTGVYAEPSVVERAAWEFADMGNMLAAAEKLFGPYNWGRYDVIVLPTGFPYGGMENPDLTFLSPTIIAGDRSLVSVVAHELAHSWSGNQVTNATWNDAWLNEGITTYFEGRIVEALFGKSESDMQQVIGYQSLLNTIKELGAGNNDTKLKTDFDGRDPDGAIGDIAYEKGAAFLRHTEAAAGREKFDAFLTGYFKKHAFKSVTSEQFVNDLNSDLIKGDSLLAKKINARQWIYETGLPADIEAVRATAFDSIDTAVNEWIKTGSSKALAGIASTNKKLYFIAHIPVDSNNKAITLQRLKTADSLLHFTGTGNSEVGLVWYKLAIEQQYKPAYKAVETYIETRGRMKFLLPLYKAMSKTPEGKKWAVAIFTKTKNAYHPVAQQRIKSILQQ